MTISFFFFKILGFWPLKCQKIENIQTFKKTVTYVIQLLVVYQCTKFQVNSSIFDPKWSVFVSEIIPIYDVIFSNAIFVTSGGRMQKQMTPIDSWAKIGQNRYLFLSTFVNLKIWPFLTWPWPDLRWKLLKTASDDQTNVTIEFYGQNWP